MHVHVDEHVVRCPIWIMACETADGVDYTHRSAVPPRYLWWPGLSSLLWREAEGLSAVANRCVVALFMARATGGAIVKGVRVAQGYERCAQP